MLHCPAALPAACSVDKIIHSTPEFPEKVSELAKSFIIAVRGSGSILGWGLMKL
jgi:hypothetical protein